MARQAQAVIGHRRLDRRAHLWGGAEEAVSRGQTLQPLVRTLEVVVLHEHRHPALAVLEVGEHGAREKLLPHRLPEALDLAAGLRVMRPALYMPDALAAKLLFEPRLAPPSRVLAPLVGQDLARGAMVGDCASERLHHQRALLVMRHREAHQVARVVIQERRHIDPLVAAQQEGKQVRLPQLIGLGALETLLLGLRLRSRRRALLRKTLRLQHPAHRRLRCANPEEAPYHVADASAARLRLGLLRRQHRLVAGIRLRYFVRFLAPAPRSGLQRRASARSILPRPHGHRHVGNLQLLGHARDCQPLIHHRRGRPYHHVPRPRRPRLPVRGILTPLRRVLAFRFHSYSPFGLLRQPNRR
jgi:hypothetical protein